MTDATNQITTTLNRIRTHSPCAHGWETLLRGLGKTQADDEPLAYAEILRINGIDDALWCCRSEPQHASLWRHCAVDFAETARHLMTDPRSLAALNVARRHADGVATDAELAAARDAARDAAARDAALAVAWDAASYTASYTARAAASYAARAAARDAAIKRMSEIFLFRVGGAP